MDNTAQLIAAARNKNGLSLADVADLSGASRTYVRVIENGGKLIDGKLTPYRPSDQVLLAVSYAVGADINEVIKSAGIEVGALELQRIECEVRLRAAGKNGIAAALKTLRQVTILPSEA
ncbi:helix-turn-helix domain-containing protein [Corynebacterium pseudogenitalium]|uniref:Helix-turn-helix transcriptional regulator n=1 Tax=Corynebacterium pseudogenitalium TaxID=38303 RepID=A0ABD4TUB1_9CORY|nr:helix-turn-helix transcriptional regulator [Corynebacterium pseudogenitalium]MCQ4615225.1 helix-turn-helix transcriptional regulator [Corynebacterium pseudogenitalium]